MNATESTHAGESERLLAENAALRAHVTACQAASTRDIDGARAARRETREAVLLLALATKRLATLTDALIAELTVHAAGDGYFCSWCEANAEGGSRCAPTFAEVEHDAACPIAGVVS